DVTDATSERGARDLLPLVPTRREVVLPGVVVPLELGRKRSLAALSAAISGGAKLVLVPQLDPTVAEPGPDDLHAVGVLCEVLGVKRAEPTRAIATIRALERLRIEEVVAGDHLGARVSELARV